jgi:hypothetical protein
MPLEPRALSSCLLVYACIPVVLSGSEQHGHLEWAWSSVYGTGWGTAERLTAVH